MKQKESGQLYGYCETWIGRPVRKFRLHTWLDIKQLKPRYGVQVLEEGTRTYAHVFSDNGHPVLFEKEAEALEYGMAFLAKHSSVEEASHAQA